MVSLRAGFLLPTGSDCADTRSPEHPSASAGGGALGATPRNASHGRSHAVPVQLHGPGFGDSPRLWRRGGGLLAQREESRGCPCSATTGGSARRGSSLFLRGLGDLLGLHLPFRHGPAAIGSGHRPPCPWLGFTLSAGNAFKAEPSEYVGRAMQRCRPCSRPHALARLRPLASGFLRPPGPPRLRAGDPSGSAALQC